MKLPARLPVIAIVMALLPLISFAAPTIYINQVGFDAAGPKIAVVGTDAALTASTNFTLVNTKTKQVAYTGTLGAATQVDDWNTGQTYYRADFSGFKTVGKYTLNVMVNGKQYTSAGFTIESNALARLTIPSIIHYYNKQRANTPQEVAADTKVQLYGSDKRVDMHGGWCDASGDVSKYFSHLAYANFVSPQQTPLVVWSMANAVDNIPKLLTELHVKDSMVNEALWGADYMMRALSRDDYFYMIIFSYFSKNPNDRRVVGLHANSVTTDEYQSAFREGGGMAIAALAKVARWKQHGEYTSQQYLDAAKRAYAHLLVNNTKYDDDHKENIIDDYCALMASIELWKTTGEALYRDDARKRAKNLEGRMSADGYFIANDGNRPFWHAADAGLPVIALVQYVKKEDDAMLRTAALNTIQQALDYNLRVTNNTGNPFGYARQSFLYKGEVKDGFFIPHENETGWWWQGEDARLGSLATAAIEGGRLVYGGKGAWGVKDSLAAYASQQASWILGCNPYSMCFMYGFGVKNVPYMHSSFGHGSEKGGISNGVTGKDGNGDGSGIDFKTEAEGNEWRWTEQWLPHAAWFLQAVTAMAEEK